MHVLVNILAAGGGKTVPVEVDPNDTVASMKQKITEPMVQKHILFGGKRLRDDRTLASYLIQDNSTVFLLRRMRF